MRRAPHRVKEYLRRLVDGDIYFVGIAPVHASTLVLHELCGGLRRREFSSHSLSGGGKKIDLAVPMLHVVGRRPIAVCLMD